MSGIAVRSGRQGLRGGLRFDIGGEAKGQVCMLCCYFYNEPLPA